MTTVHSPHTSNAEQATTVMRPMRLASPCGPSRSPVPAAEDRARRRQRRLASYEKRAAGWGRTLSESFSVISRDISFDVAERMKTVLTEAEREISSGDPRKDWTRYATEVDRRLVEQAWRSHQVAVNAVRSLSARSARELGLTETVVIDPPPPSVRSSLTTVVPGGSAEKSGRLSAVVNILMRGYMGFMMLLVLSNTVFKVPLPVWFGALPFGLLAAVAWREERARRLAARRAEALRLTRGHVDEFAARATKDTQDLLRTLDKGLRLAYRARVERLLATPEWR